ncbi:sulfatase-like hydrolase/transferase [Gimesia benthica]|uniref:Sulfatase-like hydrolase/transferase n=1 Tax=Gimesia benthica TaxID=2608982 RepID=A0A6I6A7M4_9PLAN|nr:sulfatase-like hydrolase/transferase [Gimesia benthica]QGQ22086.1 sulfatase-like hydrolase/transferase [Gimesia benthica]
MTDQRPNIIFIITDQQRFDTIHAAGYDFMETPHLDRLHREGIVFNNCFITAASCAPARASLFTGHYPHTTGILKNADTWKHGWIENLQEGGYQTVNIGKMHSWPYTTPLGFDQRYVVENKDRYLEGRYFYDEWDKALRARGLVKQQRELYRQLPDYRESLGAFDWLLDEDMHPDMFVGNMAVDWIRNYPVSEPLFLEIGFPGPHPPYDPIPRYTESYLKKDLNIAPVLESDLTHQPDPLKAMRIHNNEVDHDSVVHLLEPTEEQRHRQRAYYLANVTMIDEKVGEIMTALEEKGLLDNSIVIFSSDHGDCLTDHGHSQKWTMYDVITRVPMIIWAPGRFGEPRAIDGLVQQMDLGPTLMELADIPIPEPMAARSLLPLLESGPEAASCLRDVVFAEQAKDGILTTSKFMTMVRTQDWKLVHFLDEPWGQLFDLTPDPLEVDNLWDAPEHAEKKKELLAILREWRIRDSYENSDLWEEYR